VRADDLGRALDGSSMQPQVGQAWNSKLSNGKRVVG